MGVRFSHESPSLFQSSTAVVQLTVNQLVVGSIPASGAKLLREVQVEPIGLISQVEGGALPSPATKISPAMAMTDIPYSVIHTSAR